ncbi:NADPH-dependent F420 reductase [Paraburkholderia dioscoreae]|uniref:Dinucleotide-binding enzyme n=1 Tax=Paraburkholderia dioscoreae TaxID=2604047 RepID=A0A5Q4ZJJ5_9BURK|nr:NADPH-dependent F420 reductase [Paraburkholderia dioscoreae]VVD31686.1 Putative dinucleotide-binding enzyme [Paraburkholderia dioscoreae]
MKMGILGAGFIGRAMATLAKQSGYEVMISNSRGPETLMSTAAAIGCRVGTAREAAAFGDVVVVAVPLRSYPALPAAELEGKIVIDTCNYYPDRDGHIDVLDQYAMTTSELMAGHLHGARLVKAFNAILAKDFETDGTPAGTPHRRALPMAGDDLAAKQVVAGILDQFGFDAVDAGSLSGSWRFERAKPVYCVRLNRAGVLEKLAEAKRDVELPHGSWRR